MIMGKQSRILFSVINAYARRQSNHVIKLEQSASRFPLEGARGWLRGGQNQQLTINNQKSTIRFYAFTTKYTLNVDPLSTSLSISILPPNAVICVFTR